MNGALLQAVKKLDDEEIGPEVINEQPTPPGISEDKIIDLTTEDSLKKFLETTCEDVAARDDYDSDEDTDEAWEKEVQAASKYDEQMSEQEALASLWKDEHRRTQNALDGERPPEWQVRRAVQAANDDCPDDNAGRNDDRLLLKINGLNQLVQYQLTLTRRMLMKEGLDYYYITNGLGGRPTERHAEGCPMLERINKHGGVTHVITEAAARTMAIQRCPDCISLNH
jgi:hypothetical protein